MSTMVASWYQVSYGGTWRMESEGAVLSDVTAQKEYGVTRDFIVEDIRAGRLEFREGAVSGNPYLRVLRSELEPYIAEKLGSEHLMSRRAQTELRAIKKEIADMGTKVAVLEARKAELEHVLKL
jgi:hypothetical protein